MIPRRSPGCAAALPRWRAIVAMVLAVALAPRVVHGAVSEDGGLPQIGASPVASPPGAGHGAAMVDGGSPWADPLYDRCPADDPAGPAVKLADGSWLSPPQRAARQACLMVTCDVRRVQLEAAPPPLSSTSLLFAGIAALAGLVIGGYLGWTVARWLPR